MLVICFVLLIPLFVVDCVKLVRTSWGYNPMLYLITHAVFIVSIFIIFKLAPEIRYAYGFLLFYFVFLIMRMGVGKSRWMQIGLAAAGLVMYARIVMIISAEAPAPVWSKTYKEMDGSALPIYYPAEFDQCWNHDLPCTSRFIDGLEMRGIELSQGFRINQKKH
jgi:hypothetical protein